MTGICLQPSLQTADTCRRRADMNDEHGVQTGSSVNGFHRRLWDIHTATDTALSLYISQEHQEKQRFVLVLMQQKWHFSGNLRDAWSK